MDDRSYMRLVQDERAAHSRYLEAVASGDPNTDRLFRNWQTLLDQSRIELQRRQDLAYNQTLERNHPS